MSVRHDPAAPTLPAGWSHASQAAPPIGPASWLEVDRACMKTFARIAGAGSMHDRSSFLMPRQHPAGIEQVLVNGVRVVRDGQRNDAQPGQVLRG